jgi:hypothetical protein
MRYFADTAVALDGLKKSLAAEDRSFKIDSGEVSRDGQVLSEIEIIQPGSDMFADDINGMLQQLERAGAMHIMQRVASAKAILSLRVVDGAMEQLAPLWNVLGRLSTGLWHVDGQGFYDQGQLIARV